MAWVSWVCGLVCSIGQILAWVGLDQNLGVGGVGRNFGKGGVC